MTDMDAQNQTLLERIVLASDSQGVKLLWRLVEWTNTIDNAEADLLRNASIALLRNAEGAKRNMEILLGLASLGKSRSPACQLRIIMRNFYLYQCAKLLRAEHRQGPWITAELLSREINSFQTRKLEAIHDGRRRIQNEIERYLYEAFLLGETVPQDIGYLQEIIQELDRVSSTPSSKLAVVSP